MKVPVVGMLLKRECVRPARFEAGLHVRASQRGSIRNIYDHPRRGTARPKLPKTHQRPPAKLGDVVVGISVCIDAIVVFVEVAQHRDEVVFTRRCAQVDGRSSRLIRPTIISGNVRVEERGDLGHVVALGAKVGERLKKVDVFRHCTLPSGPRIGLPL